VKASPECVGVVACAAREIAPSSSRSFPREKNAQAKTLLARCASVTKIVRPRRDKRGVDLISDALPFGRLWYGEQNQLATQSATQSFAVDHTTL
jgi:hypothetical protein